MKKHIIAGRCLILFPKILLVSYFNRMKHPVCKYFFIFSEQEQSPSLALSLGCRDYSGYQLLHKHYYYYCYNYYYYCYYYYYIIIGCRDYSGYQLLHKHYFSGEEKLSLFRGDAYLDLVFSVLILEHGISCTLY